MPNPLISVVIPTYNRLDYLPSTLQSVLAQTYSPFEIVIVDDGSTDGTRAYCEGLTDARIRYFYQPNAGVTLARNRAIQLAQGEYIKFLDSDDLIPPSCLAECMAQFERSSARVAVVHTRYRYIDENSTPYETEAPFHPVRGDVLCYLIQHLDSSVLFGSSMVKREALLAVGMFRPDPTFTNAEDVELLIRIANDYEFEYVDAVLLGYRQHRNSIRKPIATAEGRLKALQYALELSRVADCFSASQQAELLAGRWHKLGLTYWQAGKRKEAQHAFYKAQRLTSQGAKVRRLYRFLARFAPYEQTIRLFDALLAWRRRG